MGPGGATAERSYGGSCRCLKPRWLNQGAAGLVLKGWNKRGPVQKRAAAACRRRSCGAGDRTSMTFELDFGGKASVAVGGHEGCGPQEVPTGEPAGLRVVATPRSARRLSPLRGRHGQTLSRRDKTPSQTAGPGAVRRAGKQALLRRLLARPEGASLAELEEALGWAAAHGPGGDQRLAQTRLHRCQRSHR